MESLVVNIVAFFFFSGVALYMHRQKKQGVSLTVFILSMIVIVLIFEIVGLFVD